MHSSVRRSLLAPLTALSLALAAPLAIHAAQPPLAIRTLPSPADALDAVALGGDLHVAYLQGSRVFHAAQRAGQPAFAAPTALPCKLELGPWGGAVRMVATGKRLLVLCPNKGGFFLAASDDGGTTWTARSSQDVTGHEAVESQRLAAVGDTVYLAWIDEHADKAAGDAVAKPLYLATSTDGGRTFGPRRAITTGFASACPCCVPSIAASADALHVAYRTSIGNVKEVAVLTSRDGGRTFELRQVSKDQWKFMGCPANGPALAASGSRVSVSWTHEKTINLAESTDGGRSFGPPTSIGAGRFHLAVPTPRGTLSVAETAQGTLARFGGGEGVGLKTALSKAAALVALPDGVVLVRAEPAATAGAPHRKPSHQ